ncbi:hypothetical protein ScPMuIL_010309 [Solemya velum]
MAFASQTVSKALTENAKRSGHSSHEEFRERTGSGASDQHNHGKKLFGRKSPWSGVWDKYSDAKREIHISSIDAQRLEELVNIDPVRNMPPALSPKNKKKIRPSSAASNLQTHASYYTGLFESRYVARPTTAAVSADSPDGRSQRPATHSIAPRRGWKANKSGTQIPDSVKHPRRLTLGAVDGIADLETVSRPGGVQQQSASQQLKTKIEEKINIDTLDELKRAFASADSSRNGKLELNEFKELLSKRLNITGNKENQLDSLFMKIDWSSEGSITWDEFCTYMQLEYAEKEDSYHRAKDVCFHLPAKIENIPHRDPILRITDTPDGTFVACSQDGIVSFWSSNMELKRTRSVINSEINTRLKQKWITDFVIMPHYNKFIVGTGDRDIQFFELSSFEPYCQISGLETVPLKLDYCSTGHDECLILYGDCEGCVSILLIKSAGECLRLWKKMPKHDGFIASISLDSAAASANVEFIRWKVHLDWVQQLKYYHELGQVISCSNHANTALVIGCTKGSTHVEQQLKELKEPQGDKIKQKAFFAYSNTRTRQDADQSIFKVYKGVKCFDFSKSKNIIVTGGMDRIIRLWNPYVPSKPTAMLRGHNAPIFYLAIAEEDSRIFSISTDKCNKVWDIQDHNCLLTVRPKGHKIRGDLQSCHYSNVSKSLAVATDHMAALNLRLKPVLHADIVISHKEPVTCCKYNPSFKQVVTCSEGSVIKLWDFETGTAIFDFGEAHGDSAITCMIFDNTGRSPRVGRRDCIDSWTFDRHCSQPRVVFKSPSGLYYVFYRYVIGVGWDRRINIYSDSITDSNIHHVQHPQAYGQDDLKRGHKEDILAVAQCPPNLLATASYDGEVIVWNMVSRHIFCHLNAPTPQNYEDQSLDGDLSINELLFMQTRAYKKDAASLIASGPRAQIHFWNVFQGGALMAHFPASNIRGATVGAMDMNKLNSILITGDSMGFMCVWNIDQYCQQGSEENPPEMLRSWRGHVEGINSLTLVEEHKVIITASNDCTVRLWNLEGHYIGTFGQTESWDIYNPNSYQHPMVPYDVLIHPQSLPSHPVLGQKQNTHQVVHENEESDEGNRSPSPQIFLAPRQQFYVDDDTIAEQLKDKPFNKGTGKRLRHEKKKPKRVDRGGPSEYRMLTCHDLADTPQPTPPTVKVNRDNPFDFYDD